MGRNLPFSRPPSQTLPHTGQAHACAGTGASWRDLRTDGGLEGTGPASSISDPGGLFGGGL
jgi:hypothetical protein